jgi:hypothetical protein
LAMALSIEDSSPLVAHGLPTVTGNPLSV